MKTQYTESFREQALRKAYSRGERTVQSIATDLQMSHHTLKNWMKAEKQKTQPPPDRGSRRPAQWSAGERLQALLETHGLDEAACHAWCRANGVYPQHLQTWREAIEQGDRSTSATTGHELRQLKDVNQQLERELRRKEKALAEAAALLVLQKKYQALWEDKDV